MSFWSGFATGSLVTIVVIGAGLAGSQVGTGIIKLIDEKEAYWFLQESGGKRYVLFNWITTGGNHRQVLGTSNDLDELRTETWRLPEGSAVGIWDIRDRKVVYNRHV